MLLPFFQWCENTMLGRVVGDSLWLFPMIEGVHLLGLCLLGGAILVVDLRMLGLGLTGQTIAHVHGQMRRWLVAAVLVMGVTGLLLFLSEAIKCYYNQAFWVKITTLPVALVFTFVIRDRVARSGGRQTSMRTRLVAGLSLLLWFTVAAAGRWIGFSA